MVEGKRVDIGCGTPEQKYPECIGIDINPDYKPDILHNCDEGMPFQDNELSFVNSDNSLEHFKDPRFVMKEIYRCMKPGATFRLILPNGQYLPIMVLGFFVDIMWFWNWWMNRSFKKERTAHWSYWTKNLAVKHLKDIGFKIKSTKGFLWAKEFTIVAEK